MQQILPFYEKPTLIYDGKISIDEFLSHPQIKIWREKENFICFYLQNCTGTKKLLIGEFRKNKRSKEKTPICLVEWEAAIKIKTPVVD